MRLQFVLSLVALCLTTSCAVTVPSTIRHAVHGKKSTDKKSCLAQSKLICVIKGTKGYKVEGVVNYKPIWMKGEFGGYECNVKIRAFIKGLSKGRHGFHIHTYGDISVSDGSSTGGHFTSPREREMPHGLPGREKRHWGDLGNIFSNSSKMAKYTRVNRLITLKGIIGRGMTIHEGKDKGYGFQPSGDAGSRVATCVIGIANPDI